MKESKVTAECKDGVLTIHLPKAEVAKTHAVKVIATVSCEAQIGFDVERFVFGIIE